LGRLLETTNTIMSLLTHREQVQRYADIRAYTSQAPTRLEVVAGDDDPRITEPGYWCCWLTGDRLET
jgi:hypothetical protein